MKPSRNDSRKGSRKGSRKDSRKGSRKSWTKPRQSGFALMTTMLLILVLAGLATVVDNRSRLLARGTVQSRGNAHSWHAATGGLALARHALARNRGYRGESRSIGRCQVTVKVRRTAEGGWQVLVDAVDRPFGHGTRFRRRLVAELDGQRLPQILWLRDRGWE